MIWRDLWKKLWRRRGSPAGEPPADEPSTTEPPAGESPKGEPSTSETPAQVVPAGEPSADKTPEGPQVDKAQVDKAQVDKAQVDGAQADMVPAGEVPAGDAPADGAALVADSPAQGAPPGAAATVRPDPRTARTAAEFVVLLGAYRRWMGEPSFRKMAGRVGERYSHSTFSSVLKRDKLPKLEVLVAFVEGCGGSPEEVTAWSDAWRRISAASAQDDTG